jgi:hypothetical protein
VINSCFDQQGAPVHFCHYLCGMCARLECSEKTVILAHIYVDRYTQRLNARYQASAARRPGMHFAFNSRNSFR